MSLLKYLDPNAIKDGSIEGTKIKDDSIQGSKLKNYSISEYKLQNDSIPGSKLKYASIPGYKLRENTIEVSKIISLAQSVTWSDLKDKRDAGKLIPGTYYRITDYQCTTTQINTKSAGHQFDIIVRADDVNVLNEECWVAKHEGDTYFANSNLSAWKIWYCIDNDSDRFAWALYDEELIGEINPTTSGGSGTYTFNEPIYKITFGRRSYNLKIGVKTQIYWGPNVYVTKTDDYTLVVEDKYNFVRDEIPVYAFPGKGVIYRMIDEWNNDIPYDFKNIQFTHPNDTTTYPHYYYTFASGNVEDNTDNSLSKSNNCYSNTIREYISSGKRTLNQIIFIGSGYYCYGNTFDPGCVNNSFGAQCCKNTFGPGCYSNNFGSYCESNSLGTSCYRNTFGDDCESNSLGPSCYRNTFGNNCDSNTLGSDCEFNYLDYACFYNSFGNFCSYNTLGNYLYDNSFGNKCSYIKFASDSSANTKYTFYQSNHFGDGCQYILFKGAETASSSAEVQNYKFAQGTSGTSNAYLTIDGKRNRSYETYISRDTNGTIKESVIADNTNNIATLTTNLSNEITARTQADTELQTQINSKQEALTLTVKDNGNIVLANIQGQSKEFMPATPSGDPMHYIYEAVGAVYNNTGEDIVKSTPWADLADDDADKTVVHKAGYWYLNGLGDITNEQMRIIYSYINCYGASYDMSEAFYNTNIRTNINLYPQKGAYGRVNLVASFIDSSIEVVNVGSYINVKDIRYCFYNSKMKYTIGNLLVNKELQSIESFKGCRQLKILKVKELATSLSFIDSPLLTIKSVLYMINNEAATAPITITLHADVYNRCMSNTDILAALEQHTNISLASA